MAPHRPTATPRIGPYSCRVTRSVVRRAGLNHTDNMGCRSDRGSGSGSSGTVSDSSGCLVLARRGVGRSLCTDHADTRCRYVHTERRPRPPPAYHLLGPPPPAYQRTAPRAPLPTAPPTYASVVRTVPTVTSKRKRARHDTTRTNALLLQRRARSFAFDDGDRAVRILRTPRRARTMPRERELLPTRSGR